MDDPQYIFVTIGNDPPNRLDKALARDVPAEVGLSRVQISRLIETGNVKEGDVPVTQGRRKVCAGERFLIQLPPPEPTHITPEPMALDICFEDAYLAVVNKPSGLVVHPAPGSPSGTLVNGLLAHFGKEFVSVGGQGRPGIVHRIDKDTSGLLVVAKTDLAHHALAAQFADHTIERRYCALCCGVPDLGAARLIGLRGISVQADGQIRISTLIGRHKTDRQRQAVDFVKGRTAVTRVKLGADYKIAARVSCQLETGRTHQIRVHMGYIGHGLMGDQTYGRSRKIAFSGVAPEIADLIQGFGRQALHAETLGFVHPVTGEKMRFTCPPPKDFVELETALKTQNESA